jgi:hypothetical protein
MLFNYFLLIRKGVSIVNGEASINTDPAKIEELGLL